MCDDSHDGGRRHGVELSDVGGDGVDRLGEEVARLCCGGKVGLPVGSDERREPRQLHGSTARGGDAQGMVVGGCRWRRREGRDN